MNLVTPASVQKLQTALHAKAKGSPNFRFYSLYDKMYRRDVLEFAYECCKANGGAAGVDGQTFEDIEEYGWSAGWTSWRKSWNVERIDHFLSGGCTYPNRMGNSGR
jgi:hypothetical protein